MSNAERDALISDANKYNLMHPSLTRKAVGLSEAEFFTLAPSVGGKAPPVLQPTLPTMQKAPAAASLSEEDDDVQSFKQWKQLMNKKLHDKSDPVYVPEALGSSAKKLKKQHEEERARRLREIRGITSSADDCESESESDDEWEGVSLKRAARTNRMVTSSEEEEDLRSTNPRSKKVRFSIILLTFLSQRARVPSATVRIQPQLLRFCFRCRKQQINAPEQQCSCHSVTRDIWVLFSMMKTGTKCTRATVLVPTRV